MDNAEWDTFLQYISDDVLSTPSEYPVSEITGVPFNIQHPTPAQVLTPQASVRIVSPSTFSLNWLTAPGL